MKHADEANEVFGKISPGARAALKMMAEITPSPDRVRWQVTQQMLVELEVSGLVRSHYGPTFNLNLKGEVKDKPEEGQRYFVITAKGKRVGKFA